MRYREVPTPFGAVKVRRIFGAKRFDMEVETPVPAQILLPNGEMFCAEKGQYQYNCALAAEKECVPWKQIKRSLSAQRRQASLYFGNTCSTEGRGCRMCCFVWGDEQARGE